MAHKNRWTVTPDTKSDSFIIAFSYKDAHGVPRRYRKSAGRGVSKREAEAKARALYLELEKDPLAFVERFVTRPAPVHALPFRDVAATYLEEHVETNLRPSTRRTHEQVLRVHLVPAFGDGDLRDVDGAAVDAYKAVWASCLMAFACSAMEKVPTPDHVDDTPGPVITDTDESDVPDTDRPDETGDSDDSVPVDTAICIDRPPYYTQMLMFYEGGACGLLQTGEVQCWGGTGRGGCRSVFRGGTPLGLWVGMGDGGGHCHPTSLLIDDNGGILRYQFNPDGDPDPFVNPPPPLPDRRYVHAKGSLGQNDCALSEHGRLSCTEYDTNPMWFPPQNSRFKDLCTTYTVGCGLTLDDQLECWGTDTCFEGLPESGTGRFRDLDCRNSLVCVITEHGQRVCQEGEDWTQDPFTREFTFYERTVDFVVGYEPVMSDAIAIAAGLNQACALRSNGTITCWGWDGVLDSPRSDFTSVIAMGATACGMTPDGYDCFGYDDQGVVSLAPAKLIP